MKLNDVREHKSRDSRIGPAPKRSQPSAESGPVFVNDVHSKLNWCEMAGTVSPRSPEEIVCLMKEARDNNGRLSIAGGRHAMGGQQFLRAGTLVDMRKLCRVLEFDSTKGTVTVEAGIDWPDLINELLRRQAGRSEQWAIAQKQTGADRLTIGGSLASNIHGRGLTMKPFVDDIISFDIVTAEGCLLHCSREENSDLFRLAIGGYGLFGIVYAATIRLTGRTKVCRMVEILSVETLIAAFEGRIQDGFLYGDFQFAIDPSHRDFLRSGVFSCYKPLPNDTPIGHNQRALSVKDWHHLLYLAHVDKTAGFEIYAKHYLGSSGQIYWSDLHQLSSYPEDYHSVLDEHLSARCPGSEMITELYVPRAALMSFMDQARTYCRRSGGNVIYGTIRLIEKDNETFLAWAREDFVCIVFNLHVDHIPKCVDKAARHFRWLIDCAIRHGGSFYLTYHRWASGSQILACYPQMMKFLELKERFDPRGVLQSEWYRCIRRECAGGGDN